MNWLIKVVDEVIAGKPEGEILIESGGSPSGTYHLGHMRELIICDAIMLELKRRGRKARHVYFVDNLDALRKIPVNIPKDFEQYLGMPISDVPAPDGKSASYAEQFLAGLIEACGGLGVEVEFIRSHEKYRSGYFVPVIERCLERIPQIKQGLETISNRQLPKEWTPIQVLENSRLKNREFVSINKDSKTITYKDAKGTIQEIGYGSGGVKMDWRLDWPGRWWLMDVHVEPFGREHASAGGSYDTSVQMMKDVYEAPPPIPLPYDSIHMVGDTKKMSASKGTALSANDGLELLPAEVIRYFMLRGALNKPAYFDPVNGVVKLIDEFAELAAKENRSDYENQLLYVSTKGVEHKTVSKVPFSLLVASYQAALKDLELTLEIIGRTEYAQTASEEAPIIKNELKFIDAWLKKHASKDVKFDLEERVNPEMFSDTEKIFFDELAKKIESAPRDADGEWFHKAIYDFKDKNGLSPKELFTLLYKLLIGKESGPRAGWFLSILPRDWLLKRLRLKS